MQKLNHKKKLQKSIIMENIKVIVGLGSCGLAAGAGKVYDKLKTTIKMIE